MLERADPLQPRHATLARVPHVDEVIATLFAAPHSYTSDDVVEISGHGSPVVLRAIVEAAMRGGARLAGPGEFTLRAFLNGRLDLVQVEAVADLIDSVTPLQARAAFDQLEGSLTRRIARIDASLFDLSARLEASLDFPDEGYHFIEPGQIRSALFAVVRDIDDLLKDTRRGREGAHLVISGRTNISKSSIFNMLSGHDRAIVTDVPGTTRDLVSERVDIHGIPITLVDTAGVRDTPDVVEREGVDRARRAADVATLLLVVLDQSEPLRADDRLVLSMTTGSGMSELRELIAMRLFDRDELRDSPAISNVRHIALLERASSHVGRATEAADDGVRTPEEFLLTDLQQARSAFEEITGTRTRDDLLQHIFERFCIGK